MRPPRRVDNLFHRSRRAVPGYKAATGKCSRPARPGGERLGPATAHLGQVVERGDTHVLVDMLSQRRGRTTGRRGGGALARSARPRGPLPSWRPRRGCHRTPRRLVQSSQPSWSAQHPTPLALGRGPIGGEPRQMCAREHHDHDQEAQWHQSRPCEAATRSWRVQSREGSTRSGPTSRVEVRVSGGVHEVQHPQAGAFESPWLHACRVSAPSPDRSCCRPTTPCSASTREE